MGGRARGSAVLALARMARPTQVCLIAVVYLAGAKVAAAAGAPLDLSRLLTGLAALVPVSASVHFANEYADLETDALTERTPFSGGSGVLPAGLLPRQAALLAAWGSLGVGALVAAIGSTFGRLPPAALALLAAGALFGWQYSLPPLALAWRGFGEIANAWLGGTLLPLYGYAVLAGAVPWQAALLLLPFTALVFTNLLATTWPDRQADLIVGKRTLATRWPARRLRVAYSLAAGLGLGSGPLLVPLGLPPLVAWGGLLVTPLVLLAARRYTRAVSPLPSVAAMVGLLGLHLAAWSWLTRLCGLLG